MHYETSEEEKVKLLDKPEQSVSLCLTDVFGFCTSCSSSARLSVARRAKLQAPVLVSITVIGR